MNIQKFGIHLPGCYIAGGAVLSRITKTPLNDIDVYPKSTQAAIDTCYSLMDDGECFVVNISDRAITFKHNNLVNTDGERMLIQVMIFDTFDTPSKIFDRFDFSVCMCAYDCDTEEVIVSHDTMFDIASKTIRFNTNTAFPLASLIRVNKYMKKGYHFGKNEIAKIALAVAKAGVPQSWEELERAIGGIYGKSLVLVSDKEKISFSYEAAIEVLSSTSPESFMYDNKTESKYSSITPEQLEMIVDPVSTINYIKVKNVYYVIRDGKISNQFDPDYFNTTLLDDMSFIDQELSGERELPQRFVEYTGRITGYKVVNDDPNMLGIRFTPGIRTTRNNGVTYTVGEETSYEHYPYLFIAPKNDSIKQSSTYGSKVIEVSFEPQDIKTLSPYEITVTKLKVEKVLL